MRLLLALPAADRRRLWWHRSDLGTTSGRRHCFTSEASPPSSSAVDNSATARPYSGSGGENAIDLGEKFRLLRLRHQRGSDGVASDRRDLVASEPQRLCGGAIILLHIAAEIGGIVGINRDHQPLVQHSQQRMLRKVRDHPQPDVGQRTDRERDALAREPIDQRLVLHRAHAVVDARDTELIERFPYVARRAFLAGMGGEKKARVARAGEDMLELAWRIAFLR